MKKQLLRILLVACLLVVLLPTAAMAEGTGYELIGGTAGFSGEGPGNLVDGNINTKWCLQHNQMSWVIFKTPGPMKVTGYAITTGNDNKENPGRNPKSWTLYGSTEALDDKDSSQWVTIVNVDSDTTLQDKNSTTYYFDLDSQTGTAYQYFMLKISATQSSSFMQMSEFALTSCTHAWRTITVGATCAEDGYTYEKCDLCGRETEKTAGSSATGHTYVNDVCENCGLKKHIHVLCGGDTCTHTGEHTCTERTEFTPWEKTNSLPTESGNYFLNVDVTIGETWKPADGTQLCLNGHSIVQTSGTNTNQVAAITVEAGRTFTLTDCAATPGTITHQSGAKSVGVLVSGGSFIMYGGKISGNTSSNSNDGDGGGVTLTGGSFTMCGGEISGNTAKNDGGGVGLKDGSFTMYGGKISGNTAENDGGGVGLDYGGGFTLEGGEISNNYAAGSGGGIGAYGSVNITLNNGQITGNTAVEDGGGVYLIGGSTNDYSTAKLYINNGEICGNKVLNWSNSEEIYGGGIYVARSTAYMKGGRISENSIEGNPSSHSSGAGVAAFGIFHMNDGEITNNTNAVKGCGGGGGVYTFGEFYMTAGTISGNYVYGCGGGILAAGTRLHMTGGTITGNSAYHGGGVYVATSKVEKIDNKYYSNSICSFPADMTVGGTAKITGNVHRGSKNADTGLYEGTEENNVYLPTSDNDNYGDQKINVLQGEDALTAGAYISVCTQNPPIGPSTIPITSNAPESSAFFHADRPGYDIGASETAVVLKVGKKVPTLSPAKVSVTYTGSDIPTTAITGTATYKGSTVSGNWSWKDDKAPKVVADSSSNGKHWYAVFTPDDAVAAIYDSVTTEVTVTVNPKPLEVILKPANGRPLQGVNRVYQPDNYTVDLNGGGELSGVVYHGDVKDDVTMVHGTGTVTINTPGYRDVTTNITLTGTDSVNYTIVQPTGVKVSIKQRTLSDAEVTLTPSSIPFDGLPHAPSSVTVKVDGYTLTQDTDYTCTITPQTDLGTYEVKVETRPGSCYSDYAIQTWEITNDSVAEPPVTVSYKLSTNYVTVSGLPKGVQATLIVVQYNGSQMVDVRVNTIDADIYFPPGTSFDKTKGDSYKVFLLNSTGVPLSVATGAT